MKSKNSVTVVILAAGKGTRMQSDLPKVLHAVGGKPLVWHVVQQAAFLQPQKICVVVPQDSVAIQKALGAESKIHFATQNQQLGTGDAVRAATTVLKTSSGCVVVLNGDMPLLKPETLQALVQQFRRDKAQVLLTTLVAGPTSDFGRIERDAEGQLLRIVEVRDATPAQKQIPEVNVGVYIFDAAFLQKNIRKLKTNNAQKEYYLTDIVGLAVQQKQKVTSYTLSNSQEALGVNSQKDLNLANTYFYEGQRHSFMSQGVVMLGQEVFIDAGVQLARGVRLESPCYLKGLTCIGENTLIETGVVMHNSLVGDHAQIKAHSYLNQAIVGPQCEVGPFAHLRPGTDLARQVKVGNFVEIKKSTLGVGSKANHLAYLGDATIGKGVNVGAGTITCNYDGENKFKTVLEDGVFIGSDTQLVAPVTVGEGAFVAAGSTITKNVSAFALALSRTQQVERPNWAKKRQTTKNR